MKTTTALLLACLGASLASEASAQTVSPAFDAWLKARRDAHARLLPAPPVATVATPGLGLPHAPTVAMPAPAPATEYAPARVVEAAPEYAPTHLVEATPVDARPAPAVPTCSIVATPVPSAPPVPEPRPSNIIAEPPVAVAPPQEQAPAVAPMAAVRPAPVPAPRARTQTVAAAPAHHTQTALIAPPVTPAPPVAAPRVSSDAPGIPTRDYDMALAPRVSLATGGVDMAQYLELSRNYLRYQ